MGFRCDQLKEAVFNLLFGNDFFELTPTRFCEQNLLRLRRKTRFDRLSPPADSRAFGARYSRFALVTYFSRTVLNRVFDKDYAIMGFLIGANGVDML